MSDRRILIDTRPLADARCGGVKRVTEQLIREILSSSIDAEIYFATTGTKPFTLPEWISSHPNTHAIHLNWPNKIWSLMAMFGLVSIDGEAAKKIREDGTPRAFDRVIIPNLGFTGFITAPYALLLHDLSFVINPRWFPSKSRIWHIAVNPNELIRRAAKLFSVSETTARDAVRIYGCELEKIGIVKPGVGSRESGVGNENNAPSVAKASGQAPSYVLILGNGDPRKNVPTAIKAFEILQRDPLFANFKLIIVGSSRPTIYDLRSTTIEYRNSVSEDELKKLYTSSSLFLYPSWYEGYGLPLHEAARFGIPCIASTDGALPETAPEGTVFVPPAKPHLWAKAMKDVLSVPDRHRIHFDETNEKPDFTSLIEWVRR